MKASRTIGWLVALAPTAIYGQFDFRIAGREVQVHSFASQGFAYSNQNNYLTMKTSDGSFQMHDVGVNASMNLTDKLRIGAQFYTRDFGNLGQWDPQLDWAVADYRFTDWFGIRGGVVKTVFGLHNDTQDMEFLHTSALLPQSIYPTDLRDALIRHRGGDLYGNVSFGAWGRLAYTGFAGWRDDGRNGGYIYLLRAVGVDYKNYSGLQWGGDINWSTPIEGLKVGFSHMNQDVQAKGDWTFAIDPSFPPITVETEERTKKDQANQAYAQFTKGNFRFDFEYRRWWRDQLVFSGTSHVTTDTRAWYVLGAYRIARYLEVGSYYSRINTNWRGILDFGAGPFVTTAPPQSSPDRHVYDKAITARVDLNRYWNIKVEGHFMDGWGGGMYPNGFYTADNPGGIQPTTNVFLVRTGLNF